MKTKNISGFTLLELILVMVIIGVAFPVVMKGLYTTLVKQTDARRIHDFAYLFQEKMEDVTHANFANVDELALASVNPEDPVSNFEGYSREVFISYVNGNFEVSGTETDYKKINVRVTHRSSGLNFSGSTILSRR